MAPLRILLVTSLLLLGGCASAIISGGAHGGYGAEEGRSRTEVSHDAAISARVDARLVNDRRLGGSDIRVTTRRGVVTLAGTVASRALAQRAVKLAAGVAGVRRVVSHLRVR